MGRGIDTVDQSRQELHTALWSSFVKLEEVNGFAAENAPLSVKEVVEQLNDNMTNIPRPLLGIAVWSLLPVYLADEPPLHDLASLLDYLGIGGSRDAVKATYDQTKHPLVALARLYNIVDYSWNLAPHPDRNTARARLELCVLTPVQDLQEVVFPSEWPKYSRYFWGETTPLGASPDDRPKGASRRMTGDLRLPGKKAKPLQVTLDVDATLGGLGAKSTYEIKNTPFAECRGTLEAAKELGRPGATRITHERSIRFGPQPPSRPQVEMLAYWLQADTVSLVLPD
jgi:hypothetical protein